MSDLAAMVGCISDVTGKFQSEQKKVNEPVCRWVEDGGDKWDSDCGIAWCLNVGTPKENGMNFCPWMRAQAQGSFRWRVSSRRTRNRK